MLSVLKFYGLLLFVSLIIVSIGQFAKVNNDKWWVSGTTKKVRIKEAIKDIWFIMLGIVSYTGLFFVVLMLAYV